MNKLNQTSNQPNNIFGYEHSKHSLLLTNQCSPFGLSGGCQETVSAVVLSGIMTGACCSSGKSESVLTVIGWLYKQPTTVQAPTVSEYKVKGTRLLTVAVSASPLYGVLGTCWLLLLVDIVYRSMTPLGLAGAFHARLIEREVTELWVTFMIPVGISCAVRQACGGLRVEPYELVASIW